jgi:hypothetical protein
MITKIAKWWLRRLGYIVEKENDMPLKVMLVPVSEEMMESLIEMHQREETVH